MINVITWPDAGGNADLQSLIERLHRLRQHIFPNNRLVRRHWRHLLASPTARVILLQNKQGHDLGIAILLYRSSSVKARLYLFGIAPPYHRQGLGSYLLKMIENEAILDGKQAISLEVDCRNLMAHHLYVKNDYRFLRSLPNYYDDGVTAFKMQKKLVG